MNIQRRTGSTRLLALLAVVPLAVAFAPPASAAEGSAPGVTVTAVNPGTRPQASDLMIVLTAHTQRSAAPDNPSCRPQDLTLRCWGSLNLRVPEMGGMSVTGLDVHRVAVGDITCDDETGDEGGCSGEDEAVPATAAGEAVQAQVNGVAVLQRAGSSNLPVGTEVQVKITLTDNGSALYHDQADVTVNEFVPGAVKPLIYESGPQTVQQVQIHHVAGAD